MNTALIVAVQNDDWRKITGWLKELKLEVVAATSWTNGRRELDSNSEIEVILLDAGFDEEAGVRFVTMLRRDLRLSRVPVIIAGRDFSDEKILRYSRLRISDVLLLPTVKETLTAKVTRAMETGRPTVLVVDDNELIRLHLAEFLLMERYHPVVAETAMEASEILKRQTIDAVITDISLPKLSGLDLLVETKQKYPHIPVIMITGHSNKFGPSDVLAMGADGYFVKPFHNLDLMYTLHRALTERPRQRAFSRPAPVSNPE